MSSHSIWGLSSPGDQPEEYVSDTPCDVCGARDRYKHGDRIYCGLCSEELCG